MGRIPGNRKDSWLKYPILIFEFLFIKNATLLDWIEVQIMREALPATLAGPKPAKDDTSQWPLNDSDVNK